VAPSTDATEQTQSVSDPSAPGYDPKSPYYDVTADSSSTYYVGPLATGSQSGDAIRAEVTAQVDKEIAGHTSWLSKIIDPLTRDRKIQDLYEQRLADARQQLHDGIDLRSPGGAPSTVWANASHEQMNAAISQNANSATVAQASEEWVSVGNELAEHQRNLAGAISASTANWQGSGGDAAREHLANVGKWLGSTAQGATLTGRQQEIHSQTLNETQRLMAANPPVAFSVQDANARLQQITDPVQYAAQAQQDLQTYKTQQAAREQAARVMTGFDNTVGSAVATPAFAAPPKLPGMTARTAASSGGSAAPGAQQPQALRTPAGATPQQGRVPALVADGTGGAGSPDGTGGTAAPDGSGVPGSGAQGSGTPGGGFPGGSGGPAGEALHGSGGYGSGSLAGAGASGGYGGGSGVPHLNDSTSTAGYTPPSSQSGAPGFTVPPLSDGTTRGGSPYTGGGSGSGPSIPGGSPAGFTPAFGGGTGSGAGSGRIPTIGRSGGVNGESIGSRLMGGSSSVPGGAGASGAAGAGAGAGPRLPGGGGAAGGGRGIGLTGGSGSSLGGGSSSGAAAAAAAEAAGGRSAAGAAGAGRGTTTPGMAGAGGARGNGEGDKEHRLADYLEPEDPSIFAADEVVAPPVIGDWTNKDWK
jgi:hypothetical protein